MSSKTAPLIEHFSKNWWLYDNQRDALRYIVCWILVAVVLYNLSLLAILSRTSGSNFRWWRYEYSGILEGARQWVAGLDFLSIGVLLVTLGANWMAELSAIGQAWKQRKDKLEVFEASSIFLCTHVAAATIARIFSSHRLCWIRRTWRQLYFSSISIRLFLHSSYVQSCRESSLVATY
jgi:hypothetical protein